MRRRHWTFALAASATLLLFGQQADAFAGRGGGGGGGRAGGGGGGFRGGGGGGGFRAAPAGGGFRAAPMGGGFRPAGNVGGYHPATGFAGGGYRPAFNNAAINRPAFNNAAINRPAFNNAVNRPNFNNNVVNRVVNNNINRGGIGGAYNRNAYPYRSNFVNGTWPGHYDGWNRGGYGGLGNGGYGGYGNGYGNGFGGLGGLGYGGYGNGGYGGYGGYGGGGGLGLGLLAGLGLGGLGGLGLSGLGGGGWGYGGNGGYGGYGGYGNGGYGGYGNGGYGGYGSGLGLSSYTGWGFNPYSYGWGYSNYSNPFYGAGASGVAYQGVAGLPLTTTAYNYTQPLDLAAAPPVETTIEPAMDAFENARAAFKANDYPQALTLIDQTIKATPNDANAHEFRGVSLFALGQYKDSATALYPVLSAGPGWDWTTLIGLYPDVDVYTNQLRALESYRNQNPNDPSSRFVLAYLYTGQGSTEAAAREYAELVKIIPNDQLVKRLARVTTMETTSATAPANPVNGGLALDKPPADPAPAAPIGNPASTVPPTQIDGTWKATPDADTAITFTHNPDGTFAWDVVTKGQSKPLKGKSIYKNDVLALSQTDGPPLAGKVTWSGLDKFNFRLVGNGPEDPGLNFSK